MLLIALKRFVFIFCIKSRRSVCTIENRVTAELPMVFSYMKTTDVNRAFVFLASH